MSLRVEPPGGKPHADLIRRYRAASQREPPRALDRRVMRVAAGGAGRHAGRLRAFAIAAGVVLSLGLVLAAALTPAPRHHAQTEARIIRAASRAEITATTRDSRQPRLYSTDPPLRRDPHAWLAAIASLRSAGRDGEADRELQRFRRVNPNYDLDAQR